MRRGTSSERIGRGILERMGFQILEARKRVTINGVEVAEIDVVAKSPEGDVYSVEVKAGRIGVSDVRQVYTNAQISGLKPMIICKGYADAAAELTAKQLGVKVLEIPDFYALLEPEDLELMVRQAVQDALDDYEPIALLSDLKLTMDDVKVLKAIALSPAVDIAAKTLGVTVNEVTRSIASLRNRGILTRVGSYPSLRKQAARVLNLFFVSRRLARVEKYLKKLVKKASLEELAKPGSR